MASGSLALVTARAPCVSIRDQFIFVCCQWQVKGHQHIEILSSSRLFFVVRARYQRPRLNAWQWKYDSAPVIML